MMAVVIALLVLVLDQITKYLVQTQVTLQNVTILEKFFYLTYMKNTGAAWSMFSGQTMVLALVSAVAVGIMIGYLLAKKPGKWMTLAVSLMIGGALGNLVDRLFLGYVRDFLNFYIFGYDFPVFNVADMALCIGVFIIIVWTILEDKKK